MAITDDAQDVRIPLVLVVSAAEAVTSYRETEVPEAGYYRRHPEELDPTHPSQTYRIGVPDPWPDYFAGWCEGIAEEVCRSEYGFRIERGTALQEPEGGKT